MDEEEDQRSDVSPERIRGRPLAAGQMSEATHKVSKELRLEIAHVLFIDIVGYSKLLIDEQSEAMEELNGIVRKTEAARAAEAAGQLIILPTGDGMGLVFTGSVEDPVECALQISQALPAQPSLPVRMGIHSGPVHHVADVNNRENIAGAGINIAQRVMDCGDAGHILVSKRVADDLAQYRRWQPYLHELGDVEAKHGVVVSVVNVYADVVGNPNPPERFKHAKSAAERSAGLARAKRLPLLIVLLVVGLMLFSLAVLGIIFAPAILKMVRTGKTTTPSPVTSAAQSAPSIPEKSIAVLPFENLSRDPDNAFFTDGVQDQILTALAKVADLKVISRTSVMQYKSGIARNLREIGQQLGVAHFLEGSVQRAGNTVRVNAQLIDARTDAHLWAENYDRPLADVFAIQSEIAQTIAEQLQARLSSRERKAIAEAPTTDTVANELYLRACKLQDLQSPNEGYVQALGLLEEAVRRDPKFALAYAALSELHIDLYWTGIDHTLARREQARVALQKAQELQPDGGDVHLAAGTYAYHGFRDYERARQEFEAALRALPNYSPVYMMTGAVDRRQGRWDDALRHFDRAVELDPLNFTNLQESAFTREVLNRFEEAKPLLQRALAINPKDSHVRVELPMLAYYRAADIRAWRAEMDKIAAEGRESASQAALWLVQCALAERNAGAADAALAVIPEAGAASPYDNSLIPREWFIGLVARTFGNASAAQAAFARARAILAKKAEEQLEYAPAWSLLGMCDAALGHKNDAIAEGRRACELLPVAKDAMDGPSFLNNLALIYAWVGEKDLALKTLAESARIPGGVTFGELKLQPQWDALRGDPGFDKIIASFAPKN
jgi:TolB-like protein/class 3 adenylate cyclase/Flp pilus assembly protein TadD